MSQLSFAEFFNQARESDNVIPIVPVSKKKPIIGLMHVDAARKQFTRPGVALRQSFITVGGNINCGDLIHIPAGKWVAFNGVGSVKLLKVALFVNGYRFVIFIEATTEGHFSNTRNGRHHYS